MSRVELRNLRKSYKAVPIINGLDLTIEEGEFFVLLGPSGCGKTTTLRCVAGLETPSGGDILIGSELVASSARSILVPPSRRDIGMVFQSYALWPHMSVFANVAYPLNARRKYTSNLKSRVAEVLAIMGLSGFEKRYPSELSGGQQQRVALARAIVSNPGVVLFDEPLSNLDAQLRQRLRDDLRRLHEEARRTALYVTHDQAEALVLADRVAVINRGGIEQIGTAEDIFRRPRTRFVAEFVGLENFSAGEVVHGGKTPSVRILDWEIELPVPSDKSWSAGQKVLVGSRSSALNVLSDDAGSGALTGKLVSVAYLGETYTCTVAIGASTVRAISRTAKRPGGGRIGGPVFIDVLPHELVLIDPAEESYPGPEAGPKPQGLHA